MQKITQIVSKIIFGGNGDVFDKFIYHLLNYDEETIDTIC